MNPKPQGQTLFAVPIYFMKYRKTILMVAAIVSLIVFESGCYYAEYRADKVAILRKTIGGKYKYEIQLTLHVVSHGNPHLQNADITHYDDSMWIYINTEDGFIDASSNVAMVATRNSPDDTAPLKGYLKIEENKLTVALSTMMYGDGRKGDRYVEVKPYNGIYLLERQ